MPGDTLNLGEDSAVRDDVIRAGATHLGLHEARQLPEGPCVPKNASGVMSARSGECGRSATATTNLLLGPALRGRRASTARVRQRRRQAVKARQHLAPAEQPQHLEQPRAHHPAGHREARGVDQHAGLDAARVGQRRSVCSSSASSKRAVGKGAASASRCSRSPGAARCLAAPSGS